MSGPARPDVSVVIVSYNAREHVLRSVASVAAGPHEVVLVDNASSDGTPAAVRERFPDVTVVELAENIGFGAGNNEGIARSSGRYVLLLNSDAWPVDGGVERLVAVADRRPRAGVVGPRLRFPDGSPQRSVRGFPTLWRLATEYLFLRKLAPRSDLLNAFYGGGFDYAREHEAEFLVGAVLLLRREAIDEVGAFDPSFFLFSEETDLCYRMRKAGWQVLFTPEAEFVHVGGASARPEWGRMFREQLRSHVRFFAKHHGPRRAAQARTLLLAGLRLRAVLPGERGRTYRASAAWLAATSVEALLESSG